MTRSDFREATVFYILALALAALVVLAVPVIGEASPILTMLTPAVAVAVMICLSRKRRADLAGLGLQRFGFRAWPLAAGLPLAIHGASILLLAALGLTTLLMLPVASLPDLLVNYAIEIVVVTLLALCEEVGWRGYLLPRLMSLGAVPALLLSGLMHGAWHLPLLLFTDFYHPTGNPWLVVPLFLVTLTLAGVFYGFLRLRTGSVWVVAFAHAMVNIGWDIGSNMSSSNSPLATEYLGGESGLFVIGALLVIDTLLIRSLRRSSRVRSGLSVQLS